MIRIPNQWRPRGYQLPAWAALEAGCKRVYMLWHRRAGKDEVALHWSAVFSQTEPSTIWHLLPKQEQGRKAIWDAVNPHTGKRRIDEVFPEAIRDRTRDDLMSIRFKSGAYWQVLGSDNVNSLVGSPPKLVVFSEWALADPRAWALIEPILEENGGTAIFPTTPRGRNHAATMFEAFKGEPGWFAERLTARETGVFTNEQLERIRRGLVAQYGVAVGQALYRQEYEVSFEAPVLGAYYAEWLDKAEDEGRITRVPYDPSGSRIAVSFDLGIADQTALWFVQEVGREVRVLDYYASMGVGLEHYIGVIRERVPAHALGDLILPHDGAARSRQTGKSDREYFEAQGFSVSIAPRGDALMDQINAVRRFLPRCVFDREKCADGLAALRNYRAEYDDERKVISGKPVHDWASHGADSFRTLVMGWDEVTAPIATDLPRLLRRQLGCPV